jgi:hypothetical protein
MRKIIIGLTSLLLVSCKTIYVFPDAPPPLPPLSDSIKNACPGLEPLKDKSIKTLVETTISDAYEYAKCKAALKASVELNEITVREYNKYIEAYEKAKKDAKK